MPAVDEHFPAYTDDNWRAQQTTAPASDPYESEYIPEYADVRCLHLVVVRIPTSHILQYKCVVPPE